MKKRAAIIVSFREFRDEEYFIPKQVLEAAGVEVITVSASLGKAIGKSGGEAEVNVLLKDLKTADYDAIIFIGGPGAVKYIDDETCHQIAREAVETNKVLGAICIAPVILAKAGALDGKKATVWSSPLDKSANKILEENGAILQESSVVVDGKIITGDGPGAGKEFGEKIVEILK
jgi:protease I